MTATATAPDSTPAPSPPPVYVTAAEIAAHYRVSVETVRRNNGRLQPITVSKLHRYDRRRVLQVFGGEWN